MLSSEERKETLPLTGHLCVSLEGASFVGKIKSIITILVILFYATVWKRRKNVEMRFSTKH